MRLLRVHIGICNNIVLAVITGNVSGVPEGKGVLTSTHNDHVLINFVDHGGPGTIYFPDFIPFQAVTLNAGLQTMYSKKMYSKLVFYLEACEAGSIFDKQLPNNTNIYAVTASNTDESSWGTYCPGEEDDNGGAMVDGVDIDSCLGDLFSVNWMEDSDRVGIAESLTTQFVAATCAVLRAFCVIDQEAERRVCMKPSLKQHVRTCIPLVTEIVVFE